MFDSVVFPNSIDHHPPCSQMCLSVMGERGCVQHFLLAEDNGQFRLEPEPAFPSIPALVQHYMRGQQRFGQPQVSLRRPVGRQHWEFLQEQVERIRVLGQGAFGEVFLCWLQLPGQPERIQAAVKTVSGVLKLGGSCGNVRKD